MLDNINQNKLLFLDIETCGSYATTRRTRG